MKIKIHLKDSDVLHEGIAEAYQDLKIEGVSEEEMEGIKEKRCEEATELANDWFEYGEYLTVEMDTETKTIRVVPNSEKE